MNHDFADGLSGWTYLSDAGSNPGGLYPTQCSTTPPSPCLGDATGITATGSNVLVSSAHTVLPGEVLTVTAAAEIGSFATANPDSMHYIPKPAGPTRAQARIDVYDAGNPAFPSAASLQMSAFDATNIEAGPYLGSLIGDAGFSALPPPLGSFVFAAKAFDLDPYVGKTVWFAYRSSSNVIFAYALAFTDFALSC